jgi:hypothetical protein
MRNYLFLLLFSLNLHASDFLDFIGQLERNEVIHEIPKKRSITEKNISSKKQKISHTSDKEALNDLRYLDLPPDLLSNALTTLNDLKETGSYTISLAIHNEELREAAYTNLLQKELKNFVPLLREIITIIREQEKLVNRDVLHLALRVDPNGSLIKRNRERKFTSDWHNHGADDRYLFVLSTEAKLSTMIKHNGQDLFIDLNKIFFLPGAMIHKTPAPIAGKRIQISISVGNLPE